MMYKRLFVLSILAVCVYSMLGTPVAMAATNYSKCNPNTDCNNSDGCRLFGFGTAYDYWFEMGKCVYSSNEDDICSAPLRNCHEVVTYANQSCSGAVLSDVYYTQNGCL